MTQLGDVGGMFEHVKADLVRWVAEDASVMEKSRVFRKCCGFRALAVYRFGRWINASPTRLPLRPVRWVFSGLYVFAAWAAEKAWGIRIDPSASIGKGLRILHFGGIVIERCRLGENCSVHQLVHIGASPGQSSQSGPSIGDNVWIGPHARIIGPVVLGNNVTVSAGSVVKRDVADGCLVVGAPARVVRKNYDNTELLRGTHD